jgi:hypothetical protein
MTVRIEQWRILGELPELRAAILDRLVGDTDFRSLCQDYDDCSTALINFQSQVDKLPERVQEYEKLLDELEADIRRILETA